MRKLFAWLFLLTGIFAILGGFYSWGEGSIFLQKELANILIPWADIVLTGPLSIACGVAMFSQIAWSWSIGLFLSGVYVFGSVLVFISMIHAGSFDWKLVVPASSGMAIGFGYSVWCLNRYSLIPSNPTI